MFGLDSSKICTHVRRCMSAWLGKTTKKKIILGGGGNNPGKHKPAGGEEGEWMDGWTRGRQQTVVETQQKPKGNNKRRQGGGVKGSGESAPYLPANSAFCSLPLPRVVEELISPSLLA